VPEVQSAQLSRTCSSVYSYDRPAYKPGVLTCPQARLKQHAVMRQLSRMPTGVQRGPSAAAECAQRRQQCQEMQQQQARVRIMLGRSCMLFLGHIFCLNV
jgi:hypothetical protein